MSVVVRYLASVQQQECEPQSDFFDTRCVARDLTDRRDSGRVGLDSSDRGRLIEVLCHYQYLTRMRPRTTHH